jgi:steroid delta-isomerase-like uncharacterized protein
MKSSEENKATVTEFISRVLSAGEISAAGDYFHTDMIEEVPFADQGPGLAGLMQALTALRVAFPDMSWRVEEQIAEGCTVVTRFKWTGTQRGSFMGIPASNRSVCVWGMVIDHFDGAKIKATRILMDEIGLLRQLGAIEG